MHKDQAQNLTDQNLVVVMVITVPEPATGGCQTLFVY